MKKKYVSKLLAGMLGVAVLGASGCGAAASVESAADSADSTSSASAQSGGSSTDTGSTAGEDTEITVSQLAVTEDMVGIKEDDAYTDWSGEEHTTITFNGDSITMEGSGATTDGTKLTITEPGTYVISGTLNDGSIVVDATDTSDVRIVLNGVNIHSENTTPIQVVTADKVIISLEKDTENVVSDGSTYDDEELTAAIYSKADLVCNGAGTLRVTANVNNGIQSKDDLRIIEGTYVVESADDGLVGKDQVAIRDGDFTITSQGDGIKSTNAEDADCGFVYIENGRFVIASGGDGIQAETGMLLIDGTYEITADGGYENAAAHPGMGGASMADMQGGRGTWTQSEDAEDTDTAEESTGGYKGLKAGGTLTVQGGTYAIDASNDTIHSNYGVEIAGGTFSLQSGDDGIHADEVLLVQDGTITIDTCYEGMESADITVNGGTIDLTATDDGFNAAGGSTSADSGTAGMPDAAGAPDGAGSGDIESAPDGVDNADAAGGGAMQGGGMMETSSGTLTINGGTITVDAAGDGLDSNGNITQTGGDIIVEGPTDSGNGALDYSGTYAVTGGTLLAVGSSGMMQTVDSSSQENCITMVYASQQEAGSSIVIKDAEGKAVLDYTPGKSYSSFVWVSPEIQQGSTYTAYAGTTELTDITPSQTVTTISDTGEETTAGTNGMTGGRGNGGGRGATAEDGTAPDTQPDGSMKKPGMDQNNNKA
ncbi:MAG: carbohydrate-binding domain-containing protein [Lachnospiraceae bacterium]|nr:carbohydrate-binding domain-containing protein [Lachnospiraceae bacterium]